MVLTRLSNAMRKDLANQDNANVKSWQQINDVIKQNIEKRKMEGGGKISELGDNKIRYYNRNERKGKSKVKKKKKKIYLI